MPLPASASKATMDLQALLHAKYVTPIFGALEEITPSLRALVILPLLLGAQSSPIAAVFLAISL